MPAPPPHWGFLGSRLARRLFALFVLASLLPLGLSGWLSNTAVTQIAEALNLRNQAQTTRQTSRQVFDRLMAGRTLLAALPNALPAPDAPPPPGLGLVFRSLTLLGADGRVRWSTNPRTDLPGAWWAADSGVAEARPPQRRDLAAAGVEVQLRVSAVAGEPVRQFLGASRLGVLGWVAELEPGYLWAPLNDTAESSAWQVLDPRGRTLGATLGDDFPLAAALPGATGTEAGDTVESRSTLFLGAEFGAGDWTFVQRGPRPQVRWQGALLAVWLGWVAAGTLLATALLSQWQIRRALVPLQQLTDGARQLAAGATDTRVAIHRSDEIGALAGAFNDMAAHVQAQFNALEGLAAIDRDILAGVALQPLAERVVRQLAVLYPDAGVAVSWCDGVTQLQQVLQTDAETSSVGTSTWKMNTEQAETYIGRADETQRRLGATPGLPEPASEPWLVAVCRPDTRCLALLPLRRQDRTDALITIALAQPPGDDLLQPARELRDRLAVAFSAHAREQELVHRAVHDSLTGLSNRYGLHGRLDGLLADAGHTPRLALLFLDLDHFKDVNDRHGHGAGDELLCLAANRLRACAPADALVARQGGDEFAIVLPRADAATAAAVALEVLRSLSRPFALHEGEHVLGASVGITLSPEHGRDREELLRCADIALYAAKAAGRGQHVLFTAALDAATRDRVQLQAELRAALECGEFVAHYQPRVRPSDGRVTSAEALIRWQHPQRGLLYPGAFIALAEACGLIDGIGRWMLDAACAQMAHWRAQGVQVERVSVNVSAHQLISGDLPRQVLAALQRHGLPGNALELEVTESLLVGDVSAASAQLAALREHGISIALDDFGTGYSSLATLRQLPVDVMKIDRSFVTDLGVDDGAMAVARAIVALARSMHLKLVAEGIETEGQAAVLRGMGCDEMQGYLFSRPLPPEQFLVLPSLLHNPPAPAEDHEYRRDVRTAAASVA